MVERRDVRGRPGLRLVVKRDGKKVEESKINRLDGDENRQ